MEFNYKQFNSVHALGGFAEHPGEIYISNPIPFKFQRVIKVTLSPFIDEVYALNHIESI